jgi:hypothetical protein
VCSNLMPSLHSMTCLLIGILDGVFYERFKRVKDDPIIGTFSGTGFELLVALICHELAHIFESISRQEIWIPSGVLSYYNRTADESKMHHHHNEFWRVIYRELKLKFMPGSPKIEVDPSVDMIRIKTPSGVDFYAKRILDNSV